jgi:phosphatidylserine/phosphatidylglycerophosphate/cardiolipin synthase-like enzyme
VDKFVTPIGASAISQLLPLKADEGLDFKPTHPKADEALAWMGFEARSAVIELLDEGIKDTSSEVRVVAYDLSEREVVTRLLKLRSRLKIIIDDSDKHGSPGSSESVAAARLQRSGAEVKRQHMGNLQHNKTIVVSGTKAKGAICGSTNFTWRGFFVQNNHAVILRNAHSVAVFEKAFDNYWTNSSVADFGATQSALWNDLQMTGLEAKAAFSPHIASNALLSEVAKDVASTSSSLFFSLAFLYQTRGEIRNAITKLQKDDQIFSYGISDHPVKGLDLKKPDGKVVVVSPKELSKNLPEPFKKEPTGGGGTRLHHKFLVVDFDQPSAHVYFGSYNFSGPADTSNGENLLCIHDRRIATTFVVEAVRIFDHYQFRVAQTEAKKARKKLQLQPLPINNGEKPWWDEHYRNARKIRDRELFA